MVRNWDVIRADPRTLRLEFPSGGYAEMLVWPLAGERVGFGLVAVASGRVAADPAPVAWQVADANLAGLLAGYAETRFAAPVRDYIQENNDRVADALADRLGVDA